MAKPKTKLSRNDAFECMTEIKKLEADGRLITMIPSQIAEHLNFTVKPTSKTVTAQMAAKLVKDLELSYCQSSKRAKNPHHNERFRAIMRYIRLLEVELGLQSPTPEMKIESSYAIGNITFEQYQDVKDLAEGE